MYRKGDKIGPYTLFEKLGRGGFGVVWLAEKHSALAVTKVALKLPNDDDIDLSAIQREAALWVQASGHPNVLPIIDADIYDEQVVIVSEYAPDGSLAVWLKRNGGKAATTNDAVEMAIGILSGLEHLHSKRIIHRDLKPANILLQGRTPRLVDFGLARVMKTTSHSKTVSGTYCYMPPETFEGSRSEQTDIYSVGVILYEMLAGKLPYPQETDAALIGAILHGKPEPLPESINKPLRATIERAMNKDLTLRFKTAVEMRTALQDTMFTVNTQESILAKTEVLPAIAITDSKDEKPTIPLPVFEDSPYKTTVMPESLAETSLSFDSKVSGEISLQPTEIISLTPDTEEKASHQEAKTSKDGVTVNFVPTVETRLPDENKTVDRNKIEKEIPTPSVGKKTGTKAALFIGAGTLVLILVLVVGFVASSFFGSSSDNKNQSQNNERTSNENGEKEKKTINPTGRELKVFQTKSNVYEVAINADGNLVVSIGEDKSISLHRRNDNSVFVIPSRHTDTLHSVAISPNGQIVASGSGDRTIRLWDVSSGDLIRILNGHEDYIFRVLFSHDGQTIVSASGDKTIRFWNASNGEQTRKFEMPDKEELIVNISPDLKLAAFYLPATKRVRIWSLTENRLVTELQGEKFEVRGGAFSPDNNSLALGSKDGAVRLYRVGDGSQIRVLQGVKEETGRVVFNSTGEIISAGYNDGSICLWETSDGRLLKTMNGHTKFVFALAFSADNRILASGGEDKTLRLWEIESK